MMADVCWSLRTMSDLSSRSSSSSSASSIMRAISSWRSSSRLCVEATCSVRLMILVSAFSSFAFMLTMSSSAFCCRAEVSSTLDFSRREILFSSSCFSFKICLFTFSSVRCFSWAPFSSFCCSSSFICKLAIFSAWSAEGLEDASVWPCCALARLTSAFTSLVWDSASCLASWSCTSCASWRPCCSVFSWSIVSASCSSTRRISVHSIAFSAVISAMRMFASSNTLAISATRFSYMCEKDMVPGAA
mmetsp:Transcript_40167/g.76770  ORF Transcript_40167/g.76770 Transcript_40167/m.76770 type:complete len:246 (-) Transcript_40167:1789-2526(-)